MKRMLKLHKVWQNLPEQMLKLRKVQLQEVRLMPMDRRAVHELMLVQLRTAR